MRVRRPVAQARDPRVGPPPVHLRRQAPPLHDARAAHAVRPPARRERLGHILLGDAARALRGVHIDQPGRRPCRVLVRPLFLRHILTLLSVNSRSVIRRRPGRRRRLRPADTPQGRVGPDRRQLQAGVPPRADALARQRDPRPAARARQAAQR